MSDAKAPPPEPQDPLVKAFEEWQEEVKDNSGLKALSAKDQAAVAKMGRMVFLMDAASARVLKASNNINVDQGAMKKMVDATEQLQASQQSVIHDLNEFKVWWEGELGRVQDLIVMLSMVDIQKIAGREE